MYLLQASFKNGYNYGHGYGYRNGYTFKDPAQYYIDCYKCVQVHMLVRWEKTLISIFQLPDQGNEVHLLFRYKI